MALIENAKGRSKGSGYSRLFGDDEVGCLVSRAHSAMISAGTELERIIKNKVTLIEDLDDFLSMQSMPEGVVVADKQKVKKCNALSTKKGFEPDFMIFKHRMGEQYCHLVELKDGDSFDTKKSDAEKNAMKSFIEETARNVPYKVKAHFCCFNQDDRNAIVNGFKKKINYEEVLTGQEFCELLEIDYNEIVWSRAHGAPQNLRYFVIELVKIESVRNILKGLDCDCLKTGRSNADNASI